jgi:hypothetical protein
MATALPGHGTLWKVAHEVKEAPAGTVTMAFGFWLQYVVPAVTMPSSPAPPDMYSATYEAFTQPPGHVRTRLEDEVLVYVM